MWKIREIQVRQVSLTNEGYLLCGVVDDSIQRFLIKQGSVFLDSETKWIQLPKRTADFIYYKFMQYDLEWVQSCR